MKRKPSLKTLRKFWSRVNKTDNCWLWTAAIHSGGYGVIRTEATVKHPRGDLLYAHRLAYELLVGPIPKGKQIDHLCRVRNCLNPKHLEVVDCKTNCLRGISPAAQNAKLTHCSNGHPFSGENLYLRPDNGGRQCLICKHAYFKKWYAENRAPA